jgi:hypothetical protein
MENNKIGIAVSNSLISEELKNISEDIIEDTLDTFNYGTLKDIPIVNYVVDSIGVISSIRDKIFFKKLIYFLYNCKDIDFEKRVKFMEKNFKDDGKEFGEKIILIIDRLNDINKSVLMANLFRALIYEDIQQEQFFRLCNVISNCYIEDLIYLKEKRNNSISGIRAISLFNQGLVGITNFSEVNFEDDTQYEITSLGKILVDNAFSSTTDYQ